MKDLLIDKIKPLRVRLTLPEERIVDAVAAVV